MTFILLASFFFVPFNLGFLEPDKNDTHELYRETFVDVMFLIDIFFSFITDNYSEPGEQITNKKIAIAYLQSNFLPDFLSCVPSLIRSVTWGIDNGAEYYYGLKMLRFT